MRNLIVSPLMLVLFFTTLQAQSDTLEADDRYEIVGTTFYGVLDNETGTLVVDTIFPYVEIMDGPLFKVAYVHWNKDGHSGTLPQSVTEIYDADGEMVGRNYDALLHEIKPPCTEVINYARAYELRDLEAAATMQEGLAYEAIGMRREAYRKYKQAYRLCPELTIAKQYSNAIMEKMKLYQDSVRTVLRWEEYQRQLRQAEIAAANAALQASIAQLNYQNQQRKARKAQQAKRSTPAEASKNGASQRTSSSGGSEPRKKKRTATLKAEGLHGHYRTCSGCNGKGTLQCWHCGGKGYISKSGIDKNGKQVFRDVRCGGCNGSGRARCPGCGGDGKSFVL